MMHSSRNELKTGKRPLQQQYRSFNAGETLFSEGSAGRELFIIHEGRVGIYKDTPDGRVELARVEKGGIIGEMSLLDTLPRSATVVALDRVRTVVIGYAQFQSVMQAVPVWLQSIVKIVVSRLRDANRRVDRTALRNRERGLVALIKLLLPVFRREIGSVNALPRDTVLVEAYYVCRLRKKETEQLLGNLEKRSIVTGFENDGVNYIGVPDSEVLGLFEEYLILKDRRQTFKEVAIPPEAVNILSNIVYVAQKLGQETDEGTSLLKSALAEDLSLNDSGQLDKQLLDLRRRNLVNLLPAENDTAVIFRKATLGRIKKIQEWLPRFSLELQ
ncbi:MAG: cyclic nucleotide-binding domain-containing protein [Chitinispirillaceae bacterium]|nr:cyclic nucleotide-binding domain-containing protein [Chitinispirillaceae bacterium]